MYSCLRVCLFMRSHAGTCGLSECVYSCTVCVDARSTACAHSRHACTGLCAHGCMFVCMCVCVYICIYVVGMRAHSCASVFIPSTSGYIRVRPRTCVSVCICICVGVSMCVCRVTQASHRPRRLPHMHARSPIASRAYVNACICMYICVYMRVWVNDGMLE